MSKNIDDALRHQIRTLRDAGNSYTAIESALGIPLSDVIKIVKGRIKPPTKTIRPRHQRQAARSLRTARWTFKKIGAHLGISPTTAHAYASDIKIRRRQGSRVPKRNHRITEARQMRKRGDTLEKIAETFDVTEGTASKWCKGIVPPMDKARAEMIAEARQMRLRVAIPLKRLRRTSGSHTKQLHYWTRDIPNPRRLAAHLSRISPNQPRRLKRRIGCLNRECR